MISDSEIGIVVQGAIREMTPHTLRSLRKVYSGSKIILSTFPSEEFDRFGRELASLTDAVVLSEDPGALPPTVISHTAPPNNINRQIVSTMAGLQRLGTSFAFKIRSDVRIDRRMIDVEWQRVFDQTGESDRLAALSIYTRHPSGINGYLFHLSDWLTFGRLPTVQSYWSADLMSGAEASWFEGHDHLPGDTPTAKRFRALFTPEQWICRQYARRIGFRVPGSLTDRSPTLVREWNRFLAERCLIIDCASAGVDLPFHSRAIGSLFQRLDCVSNQDWQKIAGTCSRDSYVSGTGILRRAARLARHPIGLAIVGRKSLDRRLGRRPR